MCICTMYSITMLSLYFSFHSSLSFSVTVSPPLSLSSSSLFFHLFFALKTVRILLSCCLDVTSDLFSKNHIRLFFFRLSSDNIVISKHQGDVNFSSTIRDQCDNCLLINHTLYNWVLRNY